MERETITIDSLKKDFLALGVESGMTLLVHSSMKSIGWIDGGALTVIQALQHILSPEGTIVMPTHSTAVSEPSHWKHPPAEEKDWPKIRETMSAFDAKSTPSEWMGIIPETFRKQPDVMRSDHPQVSFAAWGKHTKDIITQHPLSFGLGDTSPLARIYDLDGYVLLIGVGHERSTSLHLAEHRSDFASKKSLLEGAPVIQLGVREWVEFEELELNEGDFNRLGEDFEREIGVAKRGRIGNAESLLMPQKPLVDFGVEWLKANRA